MSVLDDIDGIHDRMKELGIQPIWRKCNWWYDIALRTWKCRTCNSEVNAIKAEHCGFPVANPDHEKLRPLQPKLVAEQAATACAYCGGPHDAVECTAIFIG